MLSHFFDQQYPDNEIKTWSFSLAGTGCSIMAFGTTGYQSRFFDVPETDVEKAKVQNTIFQKIWQNSNPCTGSLILGSSVLGLRTLSPRIEDPHS